MFLSKSSARLHFRRNTYSQLQNNYRKGEFFFRSSARLVACTFLSNRLIVKRVSLEIKKKNFEREFLIVNDGTICFARCDLTLMGGSIFRRYRDHSRINSAHDVGKHWSFPCSWKLQSNYRVKVGNSIFDEGQETIHAICGT